MGIKGDKHTADAAISAELLISKIEGIGGITSKKMFGGHGIFHDAKMFGIIDSKGKCFMKVNDETKPQFEAAGGVQHSRMPYYSVPLAIVNDQETIVTWAKKSIELSK
ncbi:MAG: TfoX/Sxy family protein [Bacteroidia bacterium]|nr:TfoX/Sxy family protein [Bacteroidia bacterium]NNJ56674.1 TfoX/Sxy family protein [Bacteroidia bacterium]